METLANIASVVLLVLGFGFVIFWHELGHFLAAKAVGIKVEQFAVGFGQALLCWRKGIGMTVGTSADKYRSIIATEWEKRQGLQLEHSERLTSYPDSETERKIANEVGLGETEYRLNWVPMGGYVKMLGQDDLDPAVKVDDPRAYNNKPVSSRMLVVSAGVIMNIILAGLLFMGLFLWGFNVPPAIVGVVQPGSPAQRAGMQVGDRILSIDGTSIHDFNKVMLNIALLREGDVPFKVLRDGQEKTLQVLPVKPTGDRREILAIGIGQVPAMRGLPPEAQVADDAKDLAAADAVQLLPGDVILAIDGKPIEPEERGKTQVPSSYALFDQALQASDGKPVPLTVRGKDGTTRSIEVTPHLMAPFGNRDLDVGGFVPRPLVDGISPGSSAKNKLKPGDAVVSIQYDSTKDLVFAESGLKLRSTFETAGAQGRKFSMNVERNGKEATIEGLEASIKLESGKKGVGITLGMDTESTAIGSTVEGSAASRAGIRGGDRLVSVGGTPVHNYLDLRRALLAAGTSPVDVVVTRGDQTLTNSLSLSQAEVAWLKDLRFIHSLTMSERIEPRRTSSPWIAATWGVAETRDFVLQGYVTIKRIIQGTVPASGLSGPVGIFHMGGKIATSKPLDWLLWFLAMISANLAVVNFLPMPIVDGGLFLFLIIEKLMGRPLSPRTQSIAQIVGLAMILSVFLFVTYNDIARLL